MKTKNYLLGFHLLLLPLFLFFTVLSYGQSCLPDGITFTTQQEIDDFPTDYPDCVQISGSLKIEESTPNDITNLDGLLQLTSIQGGLWIEDNDALTHLAGLAHITSISGSLCIQNNASLMSLQGLHNISTLGVYGFLGAEALKVTNNSMLSDCTVESVCQTLLRPGVSALVYGNAENCNSIINAVSNCGVSPANGIAFTSQQQIDDFATDYPTVTEITGNVWISEAMANDITNLEGLSQFTYINGGFWIENNSALPSLAGLDHLTAVNKNFLIRNNNALISLADVNMLTTVGGYLHIESNDDLAIIGMEGLTHLDDYLWVNNNDALANLTGFENLVSIGGSLSITSNDILTNIEGVQNINPSTINSSVNGLEDIQIYQNPLLASCEVQSVCGVLVTAGATTEVHNNAVGCNNTAEIEDVCVIGVSEVPFESTVNLYPHPASSHILISMSKNEIIDNILIFNKLGQIILESKKNKVDVSHLPSGLYIIQIEIKGRILVEKLVVEK